MSTEEAMKSALSEELGRCIFGDPTPAEIDDLKASMRLYATKGYWTHQTQDCQKFTGDVDAPQCSYTIGSWESMTKHIKSGFKVIDNRGDKRAYADFEVVSLDD